MSRTLLTRRYELGSILGSGGMGVVYRAHDRLTGHEVALKRILLPNAEESAPLWQGFRTQLQADQRPTLGLNQTSDPRYSEQFRRVLAHEFQTLSGLRHPHIISVLDYGFDEGKQPFFTMELIPQPQTIIEYGCDQPLEVKLKLVGEMLQALVYLHRHGILHRDLKPGNVLVANGAIKLVDFGLASLVERTQAETVGTLAYLSPEVLRGNLATERSDLHSVGLIAYELFGGVHPFVGDSPSRLIDNLLSAQADIHRLQLSLGLRTCLARLLEKNPADRFASAFEALKVFMAEDKSPIKAETEPIRESFLQSARFIGRAREVETLTESLNRLEQGEGGVWLVGGESGVGKSRLLNEIRVSALVRGLQTASGEVSDEQGAPYRLWREVVRRMALNVELSPFEVTVLQAIAPDLPRLVGVQPEIIPPLPPAAAHSRLYGEVAGLLAKQPNPVLITLEDVQWADSNSRGLLRWLPKQPSLGRVLFIATFRVDENAALPAELPEAQTLILPRFEMPDIARLTESILGQNEVRPKVMDFLVRETEGNAFFLIEVMRALAEEVGQLDRVAQITPPLNISTANLARIIRRRLARIPEWAYPTLELVAVMGRFIDLKVLEAVGYRDIDHWLNQCAEAAVLEVQNEQWRFAHDKLREGVLANLDPVRRSSLHQTVGMAVEKVYSADLGPYYVDLAYHFAQGQNLPKERYYCLLAGKQAASQYANTQAVAYLTRALDLTPPDDLSLLYEILSARERIYDLTGARELQYQDLLVMEQIAVHLNHLHLHVEVRLRRCAYHEMMAQFREAMQAAHETIQLARQTGQIDLVCQAHFHLGRILRRLTRFEESLANLEVCINLAREHHLLHQESNGLRAFAYTLRDMGREREAIPLLIQSIEIAHKQGDLIGQGWGLGLLGYAQVTIGETLQGIQNIQQALQIARNTGDRWGEGWMLLVMGGMQSHQGKLRTAQAAFEGAYRNCREIGDLVGQSASLLALTDICRMTGNLEAQRPYFDEVMAITRRIGNTQAEVWALLNHAGLLTLIGRAEEGLSFAQEAVQVAQAASFTIGQMESLVKVGHALAALELWEQAVDAYQQALSFRESLSAEDALARTLEPLSGLAQIALSSGDQAGALRWLQALLGFVMDNPDLPGDDPLRVYWACYQVLKAVGDARAVPLLNRGHAELMRFSADLEESTRSRMLTVIGLYRDLHAAWLHENGHNRHASSQS